MSVPPNPTDTVAKSPLTSEPQTPRGGFSVLQQLGRLRDGLLVVATVDYVLGYGVWSLNAWDLGLGLLPALDAQYFVTGLVPISILSLVVALHHGSKILRQRVTLSLTSNARGVLLALRKGIFITWFGAFVCCLLATNGYADSIGLDRTLLASGSGALFLITFFFLPPVRRTPFGRNDIFDQILGHSFWSSARFLRSYRRLLTGAVLVSLLLVGTWVCVRIVERIPQALGGLEKRCATLDVSYDGLSRAMSQVLTLAEGNQSDKVVHTTSLQILFVGTEFVVFRLGSKGSPVQLKKDSVKSIQWEICHDNS